MVFVGDIHGQFGAYNYLVVSKLSKSIQVGDFGFGFRTFPEHWNKSHRFIRGNHDCPDLCRKHPNYLGEYGYLEDEKIFFVSGAYSIDQQYRVPGESWWADEQISANEYPEIIRQYIQYKPEIVVAHDCPNFVREQIPNKMTGKEHPNRTSDELMVDMIRVHRPRLWIFGHYHAPFDKTIDGVRYKCLGELELFEEK